MPDFDFDGVRQAAFDQWDELLGRIQVDTTGVNANTTQLFYSSLYRTHISPADCKHGKVEARTYWLTLR